MFSSIATRSNIYITKIPTAPAPNNGNCSDRDNEHAHASDGSIYTTTLCTGTEVRDITEGVKLASPNGIIIPKRGEYGVTFAHKKSLATHGTVLSSITGKMLASSQSWSYSSGNSP